MRGTRTGEPLCSRYRAASLIGGADPCIPAILPPQSSTFSGLGRTLNARLQGVRLDMDTMIALLIVWFLLMDDDGAVDWEQFLLTAALLLFGL